MSAMGIGGGITQNDFSVALDSGINVTADSVGQAIAAFMGSLYGGRGDGAPYIPFSTRFERVGTEVRVKILINGKISLVDNDFGAW